MAGKSIDRLIDLAISEEKKAADLYLSLVRKVKDKGAKTMLAEMAGMEKEHGSRLADFKSGKGPDLVREKVQNLQLAEYMVENTLNEDSGVQDVILFAIQCEKKAYQLYSDIGEAYGSGPQQDFMAALASEELKHKNSLERAYDDNIFQEN